MKNKLIGKLLNLIVIISAAGLIVSSVICVKDYRNYQSDIEEVEMVDADISSLVLEPVVTGVVSTEVAETTESIEDIQETIEYSSEIAEDQSSEAVEDSSETTDIADNSSEETATQVEDTSTQTETATQVEDTAATIDDTVVEPVTQSVASLDMIGLTDVSSLFGVSSSLNSDGILSKYADLYALNSEMVGYMYIDSDHEFPLMQRIDDQNFYLDHNFYGESSKYGTAFLNKKCTLGTTGITLIYGHHYKGGKMFAVLDGYKKEDYFNNHHTIQIDTLSEEATYEVVAAALCNLNDEDYKYYKYLGNVSEEKFESWKSGMSERVIRGSVDSLTVDDTIIELSTCSYEKQDNRLVVILVKK